MITTTDIRVLAMSTTSLIIINTETLEIYLTLAVSLLTAIYISLKIIKLLKKDKPKK